MSTWIEACATDDIEEEDLIVSITTGAPSPSTIAPKANSIAPMAYAPMKRCIWKMDW